MKAITQYEANDGSIHATEAEAIARDILVARCGVIEWRLNKRLPGYSRAEKFSHPIEDYRAFKVDCVALARKYLPYESFWKTCDAQGIKPEDINPGAGIGRVISDSDHLAPLNRLWFRLMCFDNDGNEYEQPYFANLANGEIERRVVREARSTA
jgi:hypothetical protein